MKITRIIACIIVFVLICLTTMAQPKRITPPAQPPTPTTDKPSKSKKAKLTTGTLTITSAPSGAAVKVNGTFKGETPLTLESQKPGSYSVTFSAEGYESQTQSVSVTAGKTVTCSTTLKKKQASQPIVQQQEQKPAPSSSSASKSFSVNGITFTMVKVEAGSFTMVATSEQGSDAESYEKPTYKVTLTNDYYLGQTEVTQALWQAVMGSNPSYYKGDNLPVENVSWEDCQTFISRLNSLTGSKFRLPTEAEWEYAARGGNKSQGYKYSGSNTIGDVAWYDENSGNKTHDVGTKAPNELGIYDMSGNVWEWCQDRYSFYSSPLSNPIGHSSDLYRVGRGGGWRNSAGYCRVSRRYDLAPVHRDYYLGLRLAQ